MTVHTKPLDIALDIGMTLARDAIWDDNRCNWLGPANDVFFGTVLSGYGSLGPTIYDGTAGIALFLAHLGRRSGDPVIRKTALGAINHAVSRYMDCPAHVSLSFYTGHVGIGYAAIKIGQLYDDHRLISDGISIVRQVLAVETDGKCVLDVMLGVAASIPAILSLQDTLGLDLIRDPLLGWGQQLVSLAVETDAGVSWDTTAEMRTNAGEADWLSDPVDSKPNLLGYAHGACGIGLALLELGTTFGDQNMVDLALRAFDYEANWFDQDRQCWPDLRYHGTPQAKGVTEVAWCHGATGIGLARHRAYQITNDTRFLNEAEVATTLTRDAVTKRLVPATNLGLCHGICGDGELLIVNNSDQNTDTLAKALEFIKSTFTESELPYPYGNTTSRDQPPGLMLGLAGTGYALLRMQTPDLVPSVLCIG